jgi:hypothetical protein
VEKVGSFKFLSVHITDKLKWSTHADSVVKKAHRRLKKCVLSPKNLTNFYIEHLVRLYHHLVRQLHCPQLYGST